MQYCVVFTGSAADRDVIKECEIRYPGDNRGKHGFKYDVLLTSYETILREKAFMRGLEFQVSLWRQQLLLQRVLGWTDACKVLWSSTVCGPAIVT